MSFFNDSDLLLWFPFTKENDRYMQNYGSSGSSQYNSFGSLGWIKLKTGQFAPVFDDGSADYIDIGNFLGKNNDYSVCCWIYLRNTPDGSFGDGVFHNGVTTGCDPSSTGLSVNTSNGLVWGIGCGASVSYANFPHNEWHFAVGTISSSNEIKLYVDGELIGSDTESTNALSNGNNLVGAYHAAGTIWSWDGFLSNFMLFDKVLNAGEIKALYRKTYIE